MSKIDYSWDETTKNEEHSEVIEVELSTRHDLQIPRRLFHMVNGTVIAILYLLFLSHQQMIHLLGTIACLIYVLEQVRINYPAFAQKFLPLSKFVIRAEEQLKESAMVPYMIAILLTIITFPKPVAVTAVLILAISDPLSAVIGIKFGRKRVFAHKSLEGSAAFFLSSFFICHLILAISLPVFTWKITMVSLLLATLSSIVETLPIKLDDNLTIPLSTSFLLWPLCAIFNLGI